MTVGEAQYFESAKDWTAWLKTHHAEHKGLWLKISKKSSEVASVSYAEALDAALCYGWIDGQRKSLDEHSFQQRFTPRTARSIWSKINRDKALALISSRQMRAAGLREIERAQQDGRWDAAYDSQRVAGMPEDLEKALADKPVAKMFYEQLDSRNRYAITFRLQTAKKAETRQKRLEQFVEMLAKKETFHPLAKKSSAKKSAA